jgi:hypothetical protein
MVRLIRPLFASGYSGSRGFGMHCHPVVRDKLWRFHASCRIGWAANDGSALKRPDGIERLGEI